MIRFQISKQFIRTLRTLQDMIEKENFEPPMTDRVGSDSASRWVEQDNINCKNGSVLQNTEKNLSALFGVQQINFCAHVCKVTFKYFPKPLRSHIQSLEPLGQLFRISPAVPEFRF